MMRQPSGAVRRYSPGRIHVNVDRQTGTERTTPAARFGDGDSHRHALHDLGEVAGRIVGWKESELRSRGAADAFDFALGDATTVCIDREFHRLSRMNPGQLRFLEVRGDPDACIGDYAHQRLTGIYQLADLDLLAGDFAGSGRSDFGVIELQLRVRRGGTCRQT